jgi:hypothetical protein
MAFGEKGTFFEAAKVTLLFQRYQLLVDWDLPSLVLLWYYAL